MSKPARAPKLNEATENHADENAQVIAGGEDEILQYREYTPGSIVYGADRFVEYLPGNLPIIITVPHGGYHNPQHVPDRNGGNHEPDIHTQELARLVHASFTTILGSPAWPHMIINRLRRGKLDNNRNEQDATGGNEITMHTWRQFHAFTRRAKREIVRGRSVTNPHWNGKASPLSSPVAPSDLATFPTAAASSSASSSPSAAVYSRGLYLDLHGQSHDRRHQLGYILSQKELSVLSDETLDRSREMYDKCSLRCAVNPPKDENASSHPPAACFGSLDPLHPVTTLSEIVRGARSFGAILEKRGAACVPSPTSPDAGNLTYFNGGYNTYVHGSSIIGAAQRVKERQADAEKHAAATKSSSSLVDRPLQSIDPNPSFTQLFNDQLEEQYFVGIQLESAYEKSRDTEENRIKFAKNLAESCLEFVQMHCLRPDESFPRGSVEGGGASGM